MESYVSYHTMCLGSGCALLSLADILYVILEALHV